MNKKIRSRWETLCRIHVLTKHYVLLAEEKGFQMKSFLQPLKEQRDAYEHLVRAYSQILDFNERDMHYIISNLDKAIGHEYRAFFDSIDYLNLTIRERVYELVKSYSLDELKAVCPDYITIKQHLNNLPDQIAEYREKKDIGSNNMLLFAKKYGDLMESLLIDANKLEKCLIENA